MSNKAMRHRPPRDSGARPRRHETSCNPLIARLIPSRLASLALGTGDLDTVYHFAWPELIEAVAATGNDEAQTMLTMLLSGKRLRDISDLPLDLAV